MKKILVLLIIMIFGGCTSIIETKSVQLPVIHTIQNNDNECCLNRVESCTGGRVVCSDGSISDCTCREEVMTIQLEVVK